MKYGEKLDAIKRYKKFHGRNPDRSYRIELPQPKVLVYLGEGLAIEYASSKLARNVPKGVNSYRHKFKSGVKVYTDKKGKALFILGGRFRVTDWLRD